jgi:tetratricopeptide (TPR) repeat protein
METSTNTRPSLSTPVGLLALCLCLTDVAAAQSTSLADSAFARSDWPTAAREYRIIATRDTANIRARFRLGVAVFQQRQFRDAIPEFQRAVKSGFQVAPAEFRLARSYAQLGQADSALAHLERAIAAGLGLQQVTSESDLAPLRNDARYLSIVQRLEGTTFPCRRGLEAHQFDFWLGDWVVTPWGAPASVPAIGHNTITAQLEHCLLVEEWTAANGSTGKSFNFWDVNRKAWRQVWTAGDGQSLDYEGQLSDNAMRFTGWTLDAKGARVLQKLTFFRISADTVRQLFEASSDSGKTWQNTFDGRYVRTTRATGTP